MENLNISNDLNKEEFIEPIVDPKYQRFTAYPINPKFAKLFKLYKEQQACIWKAEEIDFSNDYADFETLNENEKTVIKRILAFFAASDGIVNWNLEERFTKEIQPNEIKFGYHFQMMMEDIHCVSGDTVILTDKGYYTIKKLLDQNINVWNGKEFSQTVVKFTGDSKLYEVNLSNGMNLKCTPNHKWFIDNESIDKKIVFTKDLSEGDKIFKYKLPVVNNQDKVTFENPYIHGFNSVSKSPMQGRLNKKLKYVPLNFSIKTKLKWLAGVYDAIGYNQEYYHNILLTHEDTSFLRKIQLMLTTLGVNSNLTNNTISFTKNDYQHLIELGFSCDVKILCENFSNYDNTITVESIALLDDIHETFCFTEELEHAGIFNGILTGQSETYSLMLENIVRDPKEREHLFNAITTVPSIKAMADWAFKWIESDLPIAYRVVAFALVEGVFFSGAFATIFWLKKYKNANQSSSRQFMSGLVKSNKFIARDEGLHCKFACAVYEQIVQKLSQAEVEEITNEAVSIAQQFMTDALPVNLIGINAELMRDYIEYNGDYIVSMLGYEKIYNKQCPFNFMKTIGLVGKTNFFEERPDEYQDSHILNENQNITELTDDF